MDNSKKLLWNESKQECFYYNQVNLCSSGGDNHPNKQTKFYNFLSNEKDNFYDINYTNCNLATWDIIKVSYIH